MEKLRELHINDLPSDRIFVQFEEKSHKEIFDYLKKYKFDSLNTIFNNKLNWNTYKQWKTRKHYIPLWFVIELTNKFSKSYSINNLEKQINSYKGPSTSSPIDNPNFPLKEDIRMLKIVGHLLGDGHVGGGFGSKLPHGKSHSEFRNFNHELLNSFSLDLLTFGEVQSKINYKHGSVNFPNVIGYILCYTYNIKFDTFNSRLPKIFWNLDSKLIAGLIRAYADDESHVYDSSIEFYSCNQFLIKDFMDLIKNKYPQIVMSKIKTNPSSKNIKYSFSILKESLEFYKEYIGFDHPKKTDDLVFNINRINRYNKFRTNKDCKKLTRELLENRILTAKELSRHLIVSHSHAIKILNHLEKENLIHRQKKEVGNDYLWASNTTNL